jgi:hypothetical protein
MSGSKFITTFKKVGVYFDDGVSSAGNSQMIFGNDNGNGDGKAVTLSKPRYKHGEILDIDNNFVYFLEDNGSFHMIPTFRIYRIQGDKR